MQQRKALRKLYREYKDGEISECMHNGNRVYSAAQLAFDAPTNYYNEDGKMIGTCDWAWGSGIDPICGQAENCEVIYRAKGNMFDLEPVDKYNLRGLF